MTRAPISRIAAAAGIVVLAGACTLSDQDPPPLTGPSEFAQSIVIAVSPDVLPQDGASQSFITVTARDANAQPIRNLTMRTETQVNGTLVDFGTLSARNVVTGSDGKATLVYTAPPSPAVSPDDFLLVDRVRSREAEVQELSRGGRGHALQTERDGAVLLLGERHGIGDLELDLPVRSGGVVLEQLLHALGEGRGSG